MGGRILHILSQRPSRTGSGVTLEALVSLAADAGWDQRAIVGVPASERDPQVGGLAADRIHPLFFAAGEKPDDLPVARGPLPFAVPGMSDVMPYPSSVWSRLDPGQLDIYRRRWFAHIATVVRGFRPDLIHTNHVWLVSSLVKDVLAEVAPSTPVVTTCHATGLRQMELCPHLCDEVAVGCRRNDHFFVLREDHRQQLADVLDINERRITLAGIGYRSDLFKPAGPVADLAVAKPKQLLYVGKYSAAKGLPQLLDAFTALHQQQPELRLHIAGSGAGPEAEDLRRRLDDLAPAVRQHGQLDQPRLADLMRACSVLVLPSFYEGVPLVLAEAAACGCRLVATDLPGIREQLTPRLGRWLVSVPLPRMRSIDQPIVDDLPRFVSDLADAMTTALARPDDEPPDLESFTWQAVFRRIEAVWIRLTSNRNG